jgi:copper transport protein
MDCEQAREVLSARLDGEETGDDATTVESHVAGCAACRDWLAAAQRLARRSRLSAAPQVSDRTETILSAALADRSAQAGIVGRERHRLTRLGLVAVAAAQLALTVPVLIFGHDHEAPLHVAHELGSFDLALAAGFLAAAVRPRRAPGMLPLVGVAALCLVATAAVDLLGGHTDIVDEAPHLLSVAGWLLLRRLAGSARVHPPGVDPIGSIKDFVRRWRRGAAALRRELSGPATWGCVIAAVIGRLRRPGRGRRLSRSAVAGGLVTAALVTVLSVLATASPASAHAVLEHTSPASGAVLANPPHRVSLTFGEPVTVEGQAVKVYDRQLHQVNSGPVQHPGGRADTVAVHLRPHLAKGTYSVTWRAISADSHPVSGGFRFSVGHRSAVAGTAPTSSGGSRLVGILLGATRFAGFAGIIAGLGALAVLLSLWPAGRADPRARTIVWTGYGALVAGAVGGLLLQGPYSAGTSITHTLDAGLLASTISTRFGQAHLVQLGLLVILAGLLLALLRQPDTAPDGTVAVSQPGWRRPVLLAAAGLAGLGVLVATGLSGHAGSGSLVPLAMASDAVHLGSMAVWLGGLLILGVCLLARRRAGELARVLPRFSALAFTAVVAIVITGSYQSWREVRSLPAFPDTIYGRLLMAKIAGFLLLVALGNLARRWIARRYTGSVIDRLLTPRTIAHASSPTDSFSSSATAHVQPSRREVSVLRRGLAAEVLIGVAVLVLTAILVNTAQARETYIPSYAATAHSTTGAVRVSLARPTTGSRALRLAVTDSAGKPQPVRRASGSLSLPARHVGPLPVRFHRTGQTGRLVARPRFAAAGGWQLNVNVQTSAIAATAYRITIPIRRPPP